MGFYIPAMPLTVNVWTFGTGPPAAPRVVCNGNLAYGRRVLGMPDCFGFGDGGFPTAQLLVPALTDIRGQYSSTGSDLIEVPAASGRFYNVIYVDDFGKGFPNEHRFAILLQQDPTLTPWP